MKVAVNLSALHLKNQGLIETINRTLWDTGMDATYLELEITESAFMENREQAVAILREVKRLGVSISLDDFGTGYSSLSYLKGLPVDTVKIDRSFVRDVVMDGDDASITTAIILMAKALRLRVVAEGVETQAQIEFLSTRGCDEVRTRKNRPNGPARMAGRRIRSPTSAAISSDAISQANLRMGMKELSEKASKAQEQISVV